MKIPKICLLTKIIIAISLGIGLGLISDRSGSSLQVIASSGEQSPFFTVTIPPLMGVMTALNVKPLKSAIHDFKQKHREMLRSSASVICLKYG